MEPASFRRLASVEPALGAVRRRLRFWWPVAAVAVVGLVWWSIPTGPTVAGTGVLDSETAAEDWRFDGEGLMLDFAVCNPSIDRIDVDERADRIVITVHGTPKIGPPPWVVTEACRHLRVIELAAPLGDRSVTDRTGWFRIPRDAVRSADPPASGPRPAAG